MFIHVRLSNCSFTHTIRYRAKIIVAQHSFVLSHYKVAKSSMRLIKMVVSKTLKSYIYYNNFHKTRYFFIFSSPYPA